MYTISRPIEQILYATVTISVACPVSGEWGGGKVKLIIRVLNVRTIEAMSRRGVWGPSPRKILKITHHLVASGDIRDGLVADI